MKMNTKTKKLFTMVLAFALIVTSVVMYNPQKAKASSDPLILRATTVKLRTGQTININNNEYTIVSGSYGTYYVSDRSTDLKLTKVKANAYMREDNKLILDMKIKVKQGRKWIDSSLDYAFVSPEAINGSRIRVEGTASVQTIADTYAQTSRGTHSYKIQENTSLQCFGIETTTSGQVWAWCYLKKYKSYIPIALSF